MKIPLIMQIQSSDNGAAALSMMLAGFRRNVTLQEMRVHCISSRRGSSPEQVCKAAEYYGLLAQVKQVSAQELKNHKLPVLVCWKKKYYAVVTHISSKRVKILDPAKGSYTVTFEKFSSSYAGRIITLEKTPAFSEGGKRESVFDLLLRRLSGNKRWLLFISAFSAATVFINMRYLVYKQQMVDQVMSGEDSSRRLFLSFMLLFIILVQFVIEAYHEILISRVSRNMAANAGADIYRRMLYMPLSFFEKTSRGEIMERLNKNSSIDRSLLTTLAPKLLKGVSLVFYLFLIYSYNAILSTVLLASYMALSLLIVYIQSYTVTLNRSMASSSESMRSSMLNALNSIDSIKASGSEDRFFRLWNSQASDYSRQQETSMALDSFINILQIIQGLCTSTLMLFLGAYLIIKGELTIGMLSCIQSVFGNVSGDLSSMLSTTKQLRTMQTTLERVYDIETYETTPEHPLGENTNPDKLSGRIEVSHLYYRYNEGDDLVLDDVSFTIEPGEMVALVGASGCGKSTLMKLVYGLYTPKEGSITYDGKKRDEIPDVIFHSSITGVDQDINMFADSVRANLKMWDDNVEDFEMILASRDAQIHDRIMKNYNGYDSMISDGARNYSGGEQQRLELARAISAEPSVLILDEFTSALDALTEEKVFKAIRMKGTSCLIAAHRFSTVVSCDKIIVMDKGKIVEQGTHEELYAAKGLYYKLLSLQ